MKQEWQRGTKQKIEFPVVIPVEGNVLSKHDCRYHQNKDYRHSALGCDALVSLTSIDPVRQHPPNKEAKVCRKEEVRRPWRLPFHDQPHGE
jgi:hypothetical protein